MICWKRTWKSSDHSNAWFRNGYNISHLLTSAFTILPYALFGNFVIYHVPRVQKIKEKTEKARLAQVKSYSFITGIWLPPVGIIAALTNTNEK